MNKGVGRSVEFRGLTSQYLFLFAAGMLASLLLTMVLYMAGADRTLCILVALVCMSLVVWGTFRMNRRHGTDGVDELHERVEIGRDHTCGLGNTGDAVAALCVGARREQCEQGRR